MSSFGILAVALFPSLWSRLLGIAVTSFSSGLGEMTYLQLSTSYGGAEGGSAVGWFSSGTGAAGLVGAGYWWLIRGLGVPIGLGLSSLLPLGMSLAYFIILPPPASFGVSGTATYAPVPSGDEGEVPEGKMHTEALSLADKLELARPLVLVFMLPLFAVYTAESVHSHVRV
jgi:battenin